MADAVTLGWALLYRQADDTERDTLEEWMNTTSPAELKARNQHRRMAAAAAMGIRVEVVD